MLGILKSFMQDPGGRQILFVGETIYGGTTQNKYPKTIFGFVFKKDIVCSFCGLKLIEVFQPNKGIHNIIVLIILHSVVHKQAHGTPI